MDSRSGRSFFCLFAGRRLPAAQGVPHMFVHVHKEFVLFVYIAYFYCI